MENGNRQLFPTLPLPLPCVTSEILAKGQGTHVCLYEREKGGSKEELELLDLRQLYTCPHPLFIVLGGDDWGWEQLGGVRPVLYF